MKKTQRIWHHILVSSVFALYIVILVAILFRSRLETRTIKFVPFGTIFDFLTRDTVSHFFIISNLLGNVGLCLWGFILLCLVMENRKVRMFFLCL